MRKIKTTDKEIITYLTQLGLSENNINYIYEYIALCMQKSEKLGETFSIPILKDILPIIKRRSALHIYGQPSSGKSQLVKNIVNSLEGIDILWIDTNMSFTKNGLKHPDKIHVFQSAKIKPIVDNVSRYGAVVIDDFGAIGDPKYVSELIGNTRYGDAFLIATNQIRLAGKWVPTAMRSKLTVLFDTTVKLQRTEVYGSKVTISATVEKDKHHPENNRKYTILNIDKGQFV